tara:strand:- start:365 stop:1369 length:1005 start_codon:yes stop_codon:yes gene_type:complete
MTLKFLVIGSNSFSGSHFINELISNGYSAIGISRSKQPDEVFLPYMWRSDEKLKSAFQFFQIDLNKDLAKLIEIINDLKPNYIVNFASQGMVAESWLNPTDWYQTNVVSQVAFHDEIRKCSFLKKYVHISTPEVYGSTEGEWISEDTSFSPSTPYAVSRACCDMHLYSFYKAYKFPVIFTRAANVYGPGQQLYRIIPRTLLSCLTNKSMQLHGGGKSRRSFIHIKDVAQATLQLTLHAKPGSTWHISTNKGVTIKELVEMICKIENIEFNTIVEISEDRLGKDQSYLLNSQSIRSSFNWNDSISIEEGLSDTLSWVKNNLDELSLLPWTYQHKQ